jgi:hypothetical protein
MTDGGSAVALKEAKAEVTALEQSLFETYMHARRTGNSALTYAEYIARTQADGSLVQQRKKAIQRNRIIGLAYTLIDLMDCGWGAVQAAKDDIGQPYLQRVKSFAELMLDRCFPQAAEALVGYGFQLAMDQLTGAAAQQQVQELVKGLAGEAKTLLGLSVQSLGSLVDTLSLGHVNTDQAQVTATRGAVGGDTVPDGEVYAKDVTFDGTTMSYNQVQWFWYPQAEAACRADGVDLTQEHGIWCSDYYYRDQNPRIRRVPVRADCHYDVPSGAVGQGRAAPVPVTPEQFRKLIASERLSGYFRFVVRDGAIVTASAVYMP